MNGNNLVQDILGQTDIYLVDQIMKNHYAASDKILDAGCGTGRNLYWFIQNRMEVTGIDFNEEYINELKKNYSSIKTTNFIVSSVEKMPFVDDCFDHVISSAVLHFANNTAHFKKMLSEMVRVLKPGGSLFIRMTSDIGIENKIKQITGGVYLIPDGSQRFLLTRLLLKAVMKEYGLSFLEPLKTVNVDDQRCMSTLMLEKITVL
jgi:tellurite methyltransferase